MAKASSASWARARSALANACTTRYTRSYPRARVETRAGQPDLYLEENSDPVATRPGAAAARVEPLEPRTLFAGIAFQTPVTTNLSATAPFVSTATGDVNGDGIPDLVAARTNGTAQVYFGAVTGGFTLGPLLQTGGTVVALADFNRDGKLDLATATGVLLGNGNGTFTAAPSGIVLPTNATSLFAADFNGDGKPDLAVATFSSNSGVSAPSVGLVVLPGNGDGTFAAPVATTVGAANGATAADATFVVADFNKDGKVDVASPFGVTLGNGDGSFATTARAFPFASAKSADVLVAGDFDGDGLVDLAVLPSGSSTVGAAGQIHVLVGKGDGTFTDAGGVDLGQSGVLINAAANRRLQRRRPRRPRPRDRVVERRRHAVGVLVSTGPGTFAAPTFFTSSGVPVAMTTADVNGDGALDILTLNAASGATPGSSRSASLRRPS